MATYKYAPEAVDRITRKALNRGTLFCAVAFVGGLTMGFWDVGLGQPIALIIAILVASAVLLWVRWRWAKNLRSAVASVEFRIEGDELSGANAQSRTTVLKGEVTRLRYLKDGLLVRGRNLSHTLHLKTELENYDDLVKRVEEWAPANVPRIRSAQSLTVLFWLVVVGGLAVVIVAFTANTAIIAVPCCIASTFLILWGLVSVWKSKSFDRSLKRRMLIAILPIFGLLARAYSLLARP